MIILINELASIAIIACYALRPACTYEVVLMAIFIKFGCALGGPIDDKKRKYKH